MKTFFYSLVVLGFIFVVGLSFKYVEPPMVENEIDLENTEILAEQLCYIWNTEAGDSMKLSMDIRGEDVIGELYWLPAEKDKKTGIFKGKVISLSSDPNKRGIDAIWSATAEGTVVQEQLWLFFSDTIANVGFGAMKDRGDGVYIYANPEAVSYEPNLQATDCGDEAMD